MGSTANEEWNDDTDPGPQSSRARVLVVDDDDDMRALVADLLMSEGYEVLEAASGIDLMRHVLSITVERWPIDGIDVIIIDNRMPGITGIEALRSLRAQHRKTRAVLMTAFPEAEVQHQAAALGVPILSKPFSLELLTRAIVRCLLSTPDEATGKDDPTGSGVPS